MIPNEAIEAAARALYPHTNRAFDDAYEHIRERCREQARRALEAAHPVLLAELRKAHEALTRVEAELVATEKRTAENWGNSVYAVVTVSSIRAAVAAANGDGRECDYCAEPEFRQHKGFCLTRMEGAPERWRES